MPASRQQGLRSPNLTLFTIAATAAFPARVCGPTAFGATSVLDCNRPKVRFDALSSHRTAFVGGSTSRREQSFLQATKFRLGSTLAVVQNSQRISITPAMVAPAPSRG